MRQHSAGGLGNSPTSEESDRLLDQRARSVGAKRISLSIACKDYPELGALKALCIAIIYESAEITKNTIDKKCQMI